MKKSEIYHLAQIAVVNACMLPEVKLDIIHVLSEDEKLSKFTEEQETKTAAVEE